MQDIDKIYMSRALELAKQAADIGEVPVGAVVVKDGEIVGEGMNRREIDKNPLAHAELLAIEMASKKIGGWRLWQCDLYVTLEPCPMCTGAIINSRIKRVIYGACDEKSGCLGSKADFMNMGFNHTPIIQSGVCEEEAKELLQEFFVRLREKRKVSSWKKNRKISEE